MDVTVCFEKILCKEIIVYYFKIKMSPKRNKFQKFASNLSCSNKCLRPSNTWRKSVTMPGRLMRLTYFIALPPSHVIVEKNLPMYPTRLRSQNKRTNVEESLLLTLIVHNRQKTSFTVRSLLFLSFKFFLSSPPLERVVLKCRGAQLKFLTGCSWR